MCVWRLWTKLNLTRSKVGTPELLTRWRLCWSKSVCQWSTSEESKHHWNSKKSGQNLWMSGQTGLCPDIVSAQLPRAQTHAPHKQAVKWIGECSPLCSGPFPWCSHWNALGPCIYGSSIFPSVDWTLCEALPQWRKGLAYQIPYLKGCRQAGGHTCTYSTLGMTSEVTLSSHKEAQSLYTSHYS